MYEVVSNNIALKNNNIVFPKKQLFSKKKKPIVFQHVHFFIPLFWNETLSLMALDMLKYV